MLQNQEIPLKNILAKSFSVMQETSVKFFFSKILNTVKLKSSGLEVF